VRRGVLRGARWLSAAVLAAAVSGAQPALAHETLHEIQRGKAIAVKAYFADGEVLAYTAYEVYSPADPKIPWQKGRTDRAGWLAFVPDVAGPWRVKVIDDTGHGLDMKVEAGAPAAAPDAGAAGAVSGLAFVLRPLAGLLAIGAVFTLLYLRYRRPEPPR
jgi:nickel transport protein